MISDPDGVDASSRNWGLDLLLLTLALAGVSVCLFLSFLKFSGGADGLAGCGSGGCDEILSSRWSSLFGVPVSLAGVILYPVLMIALLPRAGRLFLPVLGLLAGSVIWFAFVQAVILRKFCPWCMGAHSIAVAAVIIGMLRENRSGPRRQIFSKTLFWGGVSFFSISLVQLYGPSPETHRVAALSGSNAVSPVHSRGEGRIISFDEGRKTFNMSGLPLLGSSDAKHVLVEYFDYQCPACRTMSGFIEALVEKHPQEVAVILLPVPLEEGCNPNLPGGRGHPGSCEISRIALAVWKKDPAAFLKFHRGLMANPSLAEALRLSSPVLGEQASTTPETEVWIKELISANVTDWKMLSNPSPKLPKLMIPDQRILQGLPPGEESFIQLLEKELGIQP